MHQTLLVVLMKDLYLQLLQKFVWGKVADVVSVPSSADCSGFVLAETKWVISHAAICDAFGFILNCSILILPFGCGSNTMAQRERSLEISGWFDYLKRDCLHGLKKKESEVKQDWHW